MKTIEIGPSALEAAARALRPNEPVQMLNLLRYREQALYKDQSGETPCSGRTAYFERYLPAFRRLASHIAPKRVFIGSVLGRLVGPEGARWDDALIVEYPSYAAFRAVVGSDAYREQAAPHRLAALDNARLFALVKRT
jgi:hypothetical protein